MFLIVTTFPRWLNVWRPLAKRYLGSGAVLSAIADDGIIAEHGRAGRFAYLRGLTAQLSALEVATRLRVGHLYFMDALRTVGAICILVWHYYHFDWHVGEAIYSVSRDGSPFLDELFLFYSRGLWAVQLFWIISGVIFAHVYAQTDTSGRQFFINRFARLYPLHLITLVVVAAAQLVSVQMLGYAQIVQHNTLRYFVGHLLFAGAGFNEPVWSVTAEVGVYALFFMVMRFVFRFGIIIPAAASLIAFSLNALQVNTTFFLPHCAGYFFAGVTLYVVMLKTESRVLLSAGGTALCFGIYQAVQRSPYASDLPNVLELTYFAPVILWTGALDFILVRKSAWINRALSSFGNLTYSTYLWHFPIQVIVLTVMCYFEWDRGVFKQPVTFLAWIAGMLAIAALSYRYIELPAKRWIRRLAAEVN